MKEKIQPRLKKWHVISLIILVLTASVLTVLPGMVKNYLVKNSEELVGRRIGLEKLTINYFRFSVAARNFDLYEQNQKDVFIHLDELHVDFEPWRLLRNEYAFAGISLVKPEVSLMYTGQAFNFSDLMTSSDTVAIEEENTDPVKYVVRNFSISDGYLRYEDKTVASVSELKSLSLTIPEIAWDNSSSELGAGFILGENGKVQISGNLDQKRGRYSVSLSTEQIDIGPFSGYFKPYLDAGSITGYLSSDVVISGEMENPMNVKVFGEAGIKDFRIEDARRESVMSVKDAWAKIDSLDIGDWNFCFAELKVEEPRLSAVLTPEGTNLEQILAPYLADTLDTDSTEVHYSIRNLDLKGGSLSFADLTLRRPFRFDVTNLDFSMTGLHDQATQIPMEFEMALNQSGVLKGKAAVDLLNPMNILLECSVQGLDMVSFSPYAEYYLARPVRRGVFNYDVKLAMTPSTLRNDNHISIDGLEIGKKVKEKPVYQVPVGLALYVLKDRKDHIGFELPVSGNPSSPQFKLRRIIWKTFEEFLLKTATQPLNFIGHKLGVDPASVREIPFNYLQDSLTHDQIARLDKITEIISRKPDLSFSLVQATNPDEEKALIAVRNAKIRYASGAGIAGTDQTLYNRLTVADNDPGFLSFLGITVDEAGLNNERYRLSCLQKAGSENVQQEFGQLLEKRRSLLQTYLAGKGLPEGAVQFKTADLRNLPEEMKKPQFVVEVSLE